MKPILSRVKVGRDRPQLCALESSLLFGLGSVKSWPVWQSENVAHRENNFSDSGTVLARAAGRVAGASARNCDACGAHGHLRFQSMGVAAFPGYGRGLPRLKRWRGVIMCRLFE